MKILNGKERSSQKKVPLPYEQLMTWCPLVGSMLGGGGHLEMTKSEKWGFSKVFQIKGKG